MVSDAQLLQRLGECLPPEQISTDPKTLQINSQDYAWFSNVLEEDLDGRTAEVVAWPADLQQLADTLAVAHTLRTPITIRGGGTGNYGQCVPMRGGLVVNMGRLNSIDNLGGARARVGAGVRFVDLDRAAHNWGEEIRIYPSTYLTATFAGFVAGGSMGVGSITHGTLVDGNVLAATVLPVNDRPVPEAVEGAALSTYTHAYGTTGVIVDVTVPLTARTRWEQAVISFSTMVACHEFCIALTEDESVDKRLITSAAPGVVRHFARARLGFDATRSSALLIFGEGQLSRVMAIAARHGGRLDIQLPGRSKTRLSDFGWNHTTLWVKKSDRSLTYLQCGWDIERFAEQTAAIEREYGDDFAMHGEYVRSAGAPFLASLPIIPYRGRAHLDRMIDFLNAIGVSVANPHRYVLEEGGRIDNVAEMLATKRRNDPAGLLNPGKFGAWEGLAAPAAASLSLGARAGGHAS